MNFKMFAGLIGLLLLLAFLLPPIIKLKKIALAMVVLIGIAMALYEYYESLRSKND
ncbi:MAG: hypothetical protein AB1443_11435 [Pseudomonadota bacterium]